MDKRIFFAIIIDGNESSIALLKRFDFEQRGCLPDAIHYKGQKRNHLYMGLKLTEK